MSVSLPLCQSSVREGLFKSLYNHVSNLSKTLRFGPGPFRHVVLQAPHSPSLLKSRSYKSPKTVGPNSYTKSNPKYLVTQTWISQRERGRVLAGSKHPAYSVISMYPIDQSEKAKVGKLRVKVSFKIYII